MSLNNSGKEQKETIEVKRRRQGASSGPVSGQRAEAPARQRPGGSGGVPPTMGGGGSRPSGLPTGGRRLPLWMTVVLLILFVVFRLFSGGEEPATQDSGAGPESVFTEAPAVAEVQPTRRPAPTTAVRTQPAGSARGDTWLVMLYQDADDQILEQDIYVDLNEVERVGSTDQVQIVAQVDRFRGAYQGDGDWTSARRYFITQDDDLDRVRSQMVDDLGEVNMADSATLADFVTWAVQTYPADKYALILSDHGMGWPGGWSDPAPGGKDTSRAPIASALNDNLYLMELDQTLEDVRQQAGIDQFELIGMDACLMAHLEVFTALAPHARYAVASQETEPALGWAYTGFLSALTANPGMDGAELGREIVQSYIQDDQRIVDDEARAEFLRQGSPMGGLFGSLNVMSANQLAQQMARSITITAADLTALPELNDRFNDLAYALQSVDQSAVAQARSYAQSFTSVWGREVPPSYIDLGNFVELLKKETRDTGLTQAADGVLASLSQVVIAEKHGSGKPGSTGISIYFPNSTLYRSPITGPQSYNAVARRFAEESSWDDFLAFHYTDRSFEPAVRQSVIPSQSAAQRAPGAGQIEVSPISLSANTAAPGQPVRLTADIRGQNIGYVYLFVGYYDQASNSIYVADSDYLESPQTREAGGVFYPQWSAGETFTMQFDWEPTLFAINDGSQSVVALFTPQQYGASAEEAVYTVDGTYTYAGSGEARYARLYFRDGQLRQVFGFNSQNETGAPREIIPQAGDTFTILEKWLDLDGSGNVAATSSQPGATLTFGAQMFTWEEVFAAQGQYLVGFVVSDLDGNAQQVYAQVTVR